MIKHLKTFRKLCFLIILAFITYTQNVIANQTPELPELPPLETVIIDHKDVAEAIQKKEVPSSFLQKIKNFFTFKKKSPAADRAKKIIDAENENEPFIDLGNNKLNEIEIEDKDKKKLIQIPEEFQKLTTSDEPVNTASSVNTQDVSTAKNTDNELVSLPSLISESKKSESKKINDIPSGAADVAALPISNQATAGSSAVAKGIATNNGNDNAVDLKKDKSLPQSKQEVGESILGAKNLPNADIEAITKEGNERLRPDMDKAETIETTVPKDSAAISAQASSTSLPKSTVESGIPDLPKVPAQLENANISSSSDSNTGKIEASNSTNETKTELSKSLEVQSNNNISSSITKKVDIPTLPQVPSISLLPSKEFDLQEDSQNTDTSNDDMENDLKGNNLSKFVLDEAKVLLLPNDDIVLGELTKAAEYEQISFIKYSELYKVQLDQLVRLRQRTIIENFLNNYDTNFNIVSPLTDKYAAFEAFDAVNNDNLFRLRAMMDNYPLLQARNEYNDTLLHTAIKSNNYHLTRFLVLRGSNLFSYNDRKETPLIISRQIGNSAITQLLNRASGR